MFTGAFYVGLLDGLLDGLLGVAGMIDLIVSQWIIPENSLRLAPLGKTTPWDFGRPPSDNRNFAKPKTDT